MDARCSWFVVLLLLLLLLLFAMIDCPAEVATHTSTLLYLLAFLRPIPQALFPARSALWTWLLLRCFFLIDGGVRKA